MIAGIFTLDAPYWILCEYHADCLCILNEGENAQTVQLFAQFVL